MGKLNRKEVESAERICAALGVATASIEHVTTRGLARWRQAHKGEADAWFLINFARFYRRQNAAQTEIADRLENANALGSLMLWRRFWEQGIDLNAVLQAAFKQGRDKEHGPKAGKEKRTRRQKITSEIVNELSEIPRHESSGNVHWRKLARAVRKIAGEKALSDQGKAFTELQRRRIDSLNEVARQSDAAIINQIKAAKGEGQIRKVM